MFLVESVLSFVWRRDGVMIVGNLLLALFAGWAAFRCRRPYAQVSQTQLVLNPVLEGAPKRIPWSSVQTARRMRGTAIKLTLSDGKTVYPDLRMVGGDRRDELLAELQRHLGRVGLDG